MASTNQCTGFDTLDLAILDTCTKRHGPSLSFVSRLNAKDLEKRQKNLRQRVLALAKPGSVDFDTLYERALASFDQTKITPLVSRSV